MPTHTTDDLRVQMRWPEISDDVTTANLPWTTLKVPRNQAVAMPRNPWLTTSIVLGCASVFVLLVLTTVLVENHLSVARHAHDQTSIIGVSP